METTRSPRTEQVSTRVEGQSPLMEVKHGPSTEVKLSPRMEVKQGPTMEVKLSARTEVKQGPTTEVKHGPSTEVKLSPRTEVKQGPTMEVNHGPLTEVTKVPLMEVLVPLAEGLAVERLYISAERELLQRLNTELHAGATKLAQGAWDASRSKCHLRALEGALQDGQTLPLEAYQRSVCLDGATFVDAHHRLSSLTPAYGYFLSTLRSNPELLAFWVTSSPPSSPSSFQDSAFPPDEILQTAFMSVYGSAVLPQDLALVARLLLALLRREAGPRPGLPGETAGGCRGAVAAGDPCPRATGGEDRGLRMFRVRAVGRGSDGERWGGDRRSDGGSGLEGGGDVASSRTEGESVLRAEPGRDAVRRGSDAGWTSLSSSSSLSSTLERVAPSTVDGASLSTAPPSTINRVPPSLSSSSSLLSPSARRASRDALPSASSSVAPHAADLFSDTGNVDDPGFDAPIFLTLLRTFLSESASGCAFLSATLRDPLVAMLSDLADLDRDPDPGRDDDNSPDTGATLASCVDAVLRSLSEQAPAFPAEIRRVFAGIAEALGRAAGPGRARAACAAMLAREFVAPAIAGAEATGVVCEGLVDDEGRRALRKVANAVVKLTTIVASSENGRLEQTLCHFELGCLRSFLHDVLSDRGPEETPASVSAAENDLCRTSVLITMSQLLGLVDFARRALESGGAVAAATAPPELAGVAATFRAALGGLPQPERTWPVASAGKPASPGSTPPPPPPLPSAMTLGADARTLPEKRWGGGGGGGGGGTPPGRRRVGSNAGDGVTPTLERRRGDSGGGGGGSGTPPERRRVGSNAGNGVTPPLERKRGDGGGGVGGAKIRGESPGGTPSTKRRLLLRGKARRQPSLVSLVPASAHRLGTELLPLEEREVLVVPLEGARIAVIGMMAEAQVLTTEAGDKGEPERAAQRSEEPSLAREREREREHRMMRPAQMDSSQSTLSDSGVSGEFGWESNDLRSEVSDLRSEVSDQRSEVSSGDLEPEKILASRPLRVHSAPVMRRSARAPHPSSRGAGGPGGGPGGGHGGDQGGDRPPSPTSSQQRRAVSDATWNRPGNRAAVIVEPEMLRLVTGATGGGAVTGATGGGGAVTGATGLGGLPGAPGLDPDLGDYTLLTSEEAEKAPASDQPQEDQRSSDGEKPEKSRSWWKKMSSKPKGTSKRKDKEASPVKVTAPPDAGSSGDPDDILDKYRSLKQRDSCRVAGGHGCNQSSTCPGEDFVDGRSGGKPYSAHTLTYSVMKAKLQAALSYGVPSAFEIPPAAPNGLSRAGPAVITRGAGGSLRRFLLARLSECRRCGDEAGSARLAEAMRCVCGEARPRGRRDDVDDDDDDEVDARCALIVSDLEVEHRQRSRYIAYLVRCRRALHASLSRVERAEAGIASQRAAIDTRIAAMYVGAFLGARRESLAEFLTVYKQLTVVDEKTPLLHCFLRSLAAGLVDGVTAGSAGSDAGCGPAMAAFGEAAGRFRESVERALERRVVAAIFRWAFNPNEEADVHRDELFSHHIERLSRVITPDHPAIQIHTAFHNEAPWPKAQEELKLLWAYKTPGDKARCILRMCGTVMNLLSLRTEPGSGPGADDLIPVMVFVIIKANPRALLSTVQYVGCLHAPSMEGSDAYCWLQFCSAVEFIKTIVE